MFVYRIIHSFIAMLSTQFAIKDLGDLHYFLGIQVVCIFAGFFFHNINVSDLLRKFHFYTVKSVRTPYVHQIRFSLIDGELLTDPTKYRCMVSLVWGTVVSYHD